MATNTKYDHVIHIHCDKEAYDNFQTLRRQQDEPSDSALGRNMLQRFSVEELDGAGTQRHFQATYKEHLHRIEWLLGLILTANGTTLAAITKQTGKPQTTREILQSLKASYAQNHTRIMAEIQQLIDDTSDK